MELTTQELIIVLAIIIFASGTLSFFFRSLIKIFLSIGIIFCIFTIGFCWLPEQIENIKNGNTTPEEIIDNIKNSDEVTGIQDTITQVGDYVDENKDGWIDSITSTGNKIFGDKTKYVYELDTDLSTGYDWIAIVGDSSVITGKKEFKQIGKDENIGKTVFTFEGLKQGETLVAFKYKNSEDNVMKTVKIKLIVDSELKITKETA